MRQLFLQSLAPQLRRLGEARDLGGGLGAGTGTLLLTAAVEQRADVADGRPHIQRADALGTADLMGGKAHHIHPQHFGVAGHLHEPLHRIGMQQGAAAAFFQQPRGLRHRKHASGLVVYQHHADHRRVIPEGLPHLLHRNMAGLVGLEVCHLIPLLLQRAAGLQHGAVLHAGGDDVAAHMAVLPQGGLNGPVVAFRTAGGKVQLLRLAAHCLGDNGATSLHQLLGLLPHRVLGGGIAELLRQHTVHFIGHRLRNGRGGGVIQINHNGFLSIFRPTGLVIPGRIKYNEVLF